MSKIVILIYIAVVSSCQICDAADQGGKSPIRINISSDVISITDKMLWRDVITYIKKSHDTNKDIIILHNLVGVRLYNAGWHNEYYNAETKSKMIVIGFESSGKIILSDEVRELIKTQHIDMKFIAQCNIPDSANMVIVHAELLKLASLGCVADFLILTKDDDNKSPLRLPQNNQNGELDFGK